jgi:hypothetical protein
MDPGAVRDEYCGDLAVIYTFGPQFGQRVVTHADLGQIDLTPRVLRRVALDQLEMLAARAQFHGKAPALMLSFDGLESSLLLATDFWARLHGAVPGDLVVGVPARDVVIVTGSQSTAGLEKVRRAVDRVFYAGDDNLLSQCLLVRTGAGWEPFDRPARPAGRAFHNSAHRHGVDQPPREYQEHPSWPGERVPVAMVRPISPGVRAASDDQPAPSARPLYPGGQPAAASIGQPPTPVRPMPNPVSPATIPPGAPGIHSTMPQQRPAGANGFGPPEPGGRRPEGMPSEVRPMSAVPYSSVPYSSVPYSSTPYSASPYSPMPYSSAPYSASPYSASPYSASPYSSTPYSASPYSASPYSASPYSASPYSAVPYSAMPYSAMPYSAVPQSPAPRSRGAHAAARAEAAARANAARQSPYGPGPGPMPAPPPGPSRPAVMAPGSPAGYDGPSRADGGPRGEGSRVYPAAWGSAPESSPAARPAPEFRTGPRARFSR